MNIKTVLGLLVAFIVLVGAFFLANHRAAAPVLETPSATTTAPIATTSEKASAPIPAKSATASTPTHAATTGVTHKIGVDQESLTTSSTHPTITGTATNLTSIGYVLDNPQGVGIMGSGNIPVANGRWSISFPQALAPGAYTLHIISGSTSANYTLTITN